MNTQLKFQHKEVSTFFETSRKIYASAILDVEKNFYDKINKWGNLDFVKYDSNNHYNGDMKGHIFIYNHDHYWGNGSTWCSAEHLVTPNINMDDRGYIKGIALDLTNYLKLRCICCPFSFAHEFFYLWGNFPKNKRPSFKKTKHYAAKMQELKMIDEYFDALKADLLAKYRRLEEQVIYHLTGCSLLHYKKDF